MGYILLGALFLYLFWIITGISGPCTWKRAHGKRLTIIERWAYFQWRMKGSIINGGCISEKGLLLIDLGYGKEMATVADKIKSGNSDSKDVINMIKLNLKHQQMIKNLDGYDIFGTRVNVVEIEN